MSADPFLLIHADCHDVLPHVPDASVDLILVDPPYHRVVSEAWDRQWRDDAAFAGWVAGLAREWARILKPSGSLYCFAYPRTAARVELAIAGPLRVLNHIVWAKPDPKSALNPGAGNGGRASKAAMRAYYPNTERIIFAEREDAESEALGDASYAGKSQGLRGSVFAPLRDYLVGEFDRLGWSVDDLNRIVGTRSMAGHFVRRSQWSLPTAEQYRLLQEAARGAAGGGLDRPFEALARDHADLKAEYDRRMAEYATLRRPFAVSPEVPYTDVWAFPTVAPRPGKHPCEKPAPLLEHVIRASSRPGDVVLDHFLGGGSAGVAAVALGRRFVGVERDARWFAVADRAIRHAADPHGAPPPAHRPRPARSGRRPAPSQLTLFGPEDHR